MSRFLKQFMYQCITDVVNVFFLKDSAEKPLEKRVGDGTVVHLTKTGLLKRKRSYRNLY